MTGNRGDQPRRQMGAAYPVGDREILEGGILIVDDVELNRLLIHTYLTRAGFRNLHFACDGEEALAKILDINPDLVILDLVMPKMDGFEVCRRLRDMAAYKDLPILVQTAISEPEERAGVFTAGATDLIAKPISPLEIRARTRIHLENRFLLRDLRAYQGRLTRDLEIAREMQKALLPRPALLEEVERRLDLQIAYRYESSSELGGDFWGLRRVAGGRLFFYMVDFAGHGVSAALNTFRLHSLMSQETEIRSPARYLEALNRELHKLLPAEQYATMFCGLIDPARDRLTYAAAACPTPLMGRGGDPVLRRLDPRGLPLGASAAAEYTDIEVSFTAGDVLFIYSDVLTESPGSGAPPLGEGGLEELFAGALNRDRPHISSDGIVPDGFADSLLADFFERCDAHIAHPLQDDLTAIFLARCRPGEPG